MPCLVNDGSTPMCVTAAWPTTAPPGRVSPLVTASAVPTSRCSTNAPRVRPGSSSVRIWPGARCDRGGNPIIAVRNTLAAATRSSSLSSTRISEVITTSCLVATGAVSVALPTAAELGKVGQCIFPVDQPIAENPGLVDPRIVRRQCPGVAPVPVQRQLLGNPGCAQRVEDGGGGLQRGRDDHQLRLSDRYVGVDQRLRAVITEESPCRNVVECAGGLLERGLGRKHVGRHLSDDLQQMRIIGGRFGESLRVVAPASVQSGAPVPQGGPGNTGQYRQYRDLVELRLVREPLGDRKYVAALGAHTVIA